MLVFAAATAGGACGTGPAGRERPGAGPATGWEHVQADLDADGVAVVPDPPKGLRLGEPVGAGSHVVFHATMDPPDEGDGTARDGAGRRLRWVNDPEMWVLDLRRGVWARMPDPPLEHPFNGGDTILRAWTGREVVVVGTPCAAVLAEEERTFGPDGPDLCTEGTGRLTALAYNPETRRWRTIGEAPDFLPPAYREQTEAPLSVGLVPYGWTGREVVMYPVVEPVPSRYGEALLLLEPGTGRWRWSAPFPPGVNVRSVCIGAGRVLATAGGEGTPAPGATVPDAVVVYELDPGTLRWVERSAADGPGTSGSLTHGLSCPWDHRSAPVFLQSPTPGSGGPMQLRRFDVEAGRFDAADLPEDGDVGPWLVFKGVRVGDTDAYLVSDGRVREPGGLGSGDMVLVPGPEGTWRRAPAFIGWYTWPAVYLGEGRFLVRGKAWAQVAGASEAAAALPDRARLVDLHRYLEHHGVPVDAAGATGG